MPLRFKIPAILTPAELAELETLAVSPASSVDTCHQWLTARGHKVGRSTVGDWKKRLESDRSAALRQRVSSVAIDLSAVKCDRCKGSPPGIAVTLSPAPPTAKTE